MANRYSKKRNNGLAIQQVIFSLLISFLIMFFIPSFHGAKAAPILEVSLNTSILSGQSGALVFDLINTSSRRSSVIIAEFNGDLITVGDSTLTGDASGAVADGFLLGDGQFFNEIAVPVQFTTMTEFKINLLFGTPVLSEFPDELSIFILTSDLSASLVMSDDPSGGNALLTYFVDPNGIGNLATYNSQDGGVTTKAAGASGNHTNIPEPTSFALMIVPLIWLLTFTNRHFRREVKCRSPWQALRGAEAGVVGGGTS